MNRLRIKEFTSAKSVIVNVTADARIHKNTQVAGKRSCE